MIKKILIYQLPILLINVIQFSQAQTPTPIRSIAKNGSVSLKNNEITYVAVLDTTMIYFDQGKYATIHNGHFRIYDGKNPLIRWRIDSKRKTAFISTEFASKKLFEMIQQRGLEYASIKSKISKYKLNNFYSNYKPIVPRVLEPLVRIESIQSAWIKANYIQINSEVIAGWKCIKLVNIKDRENVLWIEPEHGFILGERMIYRLNNPRLTDTIIDWKYTKFKLVPKIDPSVFQLPKGTTAILPEILADLPLPPGVARKILTDQHGQKIYL